MNLDQRLSDHFTLAEMIHSAEAERLGIDNTPPAEIVDRLAYVAQNILQPVRAHYGLPFRPNSGYRCEALERAICWGGSATSSFAMWCGRRGLAVDEDSWRVYFKTKQHPTGCAVDFEIAGVANLDLAKWCRANLEAYDQLILEFWKPDVPNAGWVHASVVEGGPNRAEVLTIGSGGTIIGLPEA